MRTFCKACFCTCGIYCCIGYSVMSESCFKLCSTYCTCLSICTVCVFTESVTKFTALCVITSCTCYRRCTCCINLVVTKSFALCVVTSCTCYRRCTCCINLVVTKSFALCMSASVLTSFGSFTCCISHIVACSRNYFLANVNCITVFTVRTCCKTCFCTCRSYCYIIYNMVTCSRNYFCVRISTSTCKCLQSFALTACGSSNCLGILMYALCLYPSAVYVFVSTAATDVSITKLKRFYGYFRISNIFIILQCLISLSSSTGIKLNNCTIFSSDISTGSCYVYITLRCIYCTCNMHLCIGICIMPSNACRLSGCIIKMLYLNSRINEVTCRPFSCVIDINVIALA